MDTIPEMSMNFKSKIKMNFDGGKLTSDSGMLLYKLFDKKIGFSNEIRNSINIKDDIDHRKHENEDVIMQRIYQNAAGYHADYDANDLRSDSVFQEVLEKDDLASQPTISRVNNKVNKNTMKQLQTANLNLVDKVHTIVPPKKLIFDLDSTNSETYSNQYGAAYNPHYGAEGYHPLLLFDGDTGELLKAELRSVNVYTSRQ